MRETSNPTWTGLWALSGYYRPSKGGYLIVGDRPGPEWWGHGYYTRNLWTLHDGNPVQITLLIKRWRHKTEGRTVSSEVPGVVAGRHFCSLFIIASLLPWLTGNLGLHCCKGALLDDDKPCHRTLQRWLSPLQEYALDFQHHVRKVIQEHNEPQPSRRPAQRGPDPPGSMTSAFKKRWRKSAEQVWRVRVALNLLNNSKTNIAVLLAEANASGLPKATFI